MDKLKNLIKNILGMIALIVLWVFHMPYAVCKALVDLESLKELAGDVFNAIGTIRFEAGCAFRRRSTHNAVIQECMKNLYKCGELKDENGNLWLGIYHFLKDQYK